MGRLDRRSRGLGTILAQTTNLFAGNRRMNDKGSAGITVCRNTKRRQDRFHFSG